MLTLAVETSSPVGSVAIVRDGAVVAETAIQSVPASPRTRRITHSTNLAPAVERLAAEAGLAISDFDLLAAGLGPGSFTGVRVAIATLKGYALAFPKPVVGVSSMDALALANKDRLPGGCTSLAVVVDAGRGEVYCSVYSLLDGQFFKVNETAIVTLPRLAGRVLAPTFFIGPGIGSYRAELERLVGSRARVDGEPVYPPASMVGLLGEEKFGEQKIGDPDLEPIYLRPAAVEAPLRTS
jgi:tRNA threonylcarbamoyladenosine biosynthesis protein TsaB